MGIIKKQGINNTIITYIGILIGFVNIFFVLPNYIRTDELGLVKVLSSFSALVGMFLPLGIGNIAVKYFPLFNDKESKHHGFFGVLLFFSIIGLAIVSVILFLSKGFFVHQYQKQSGLFADNFNLVLPFSYFISLISLFTVYCQSLFKSTFPAFLNEIIIRVMLILVIFIYYFKLLTLVQFVYCYIGVYFLQMLALLIYIYLIDKPGFKIDYKFYKKHNIKIIVRYGLLLSVTAFASLGIKNIDVIMIGKYLPLSFAGIYATVVFIPTVIEAPVTALERISNAKIAQAWSQNDTVEITNIYYQSAKYLLLLGGILFVGININLPYLFTMLPKDYSSATDVVMVLSLSTLFNMVTGLNGGIIFSSENYIYGSVMLFILMILSFINNMIFIPLYGIMGAAIATSLSSLVFNFMKYGFIWYKFKMQPFNRNTLYVILLIVLCLIVNIFLFNTSNAILNMLIHSAIITTLYGLGVYFLNIIPEFHRFIPFIKQKRQ